MVIQDTVKSLADFIFGRYEKAIMDRTHLDAFISSLFHLFLARRGLIFLALTCFIYFWPCYIF